MDDKEFVEQINRLLRLARRGMSYDYDIKKKNEKIDEVKKEHKKTKSDYMQKFNKQHREIIELKATHQDYEPITCPDCNGAGGFTWDDGHGGCGGEPCHCDGGTLYVTKKRCPKCLGPQFRLDDKGNIIQCVACDIIQKDKEKKHE